MSSKVDGMDECLKGLEELSQKASEIDGQSNVSLDELFPCDFMLRFTDFNSIEHMFEKSGFKVDSQEDFEAIPEDQWDIFIAANTRFDSWEEMMSAAAEEWMSRKLGFE